MATVDAREIFVDRMIGLMDATTHGGLVSKGPVSDQRDPARLLRIGLAAVSYAAFEDFFISRSSEALTAFNSVHIDFVQLPEKLREAATVGTVRAMGQRSMFEPATERTAFVQTHASYVYSTATASYRLSPLTFSPFATNLTFDDIERSLKALVIDAPSVQLTEIASRAGYGGIGLKERLGQLLAQRNEAAHVAAADISVADLVQLPYDLLAAALAIDAVMSKAVADVLRRGPAADPNGKLTNLASTIPITFLDQSSHGVREFVEGRLRATKIHPLLNSAMGEAAPRAARQRALLVVRDPQSRPVDWRVTYL